MKEVKAVLVSSNIHLRNNIILIIALIVMFILRISAGGKGNAKGLIEVNDIRWFGHEPKTLALYAGLLSIFALMSSWALLAIATTYGKGFFKLNDARINANGTIFPIERMENIRFTIVSPGSFGTRNFRQGFKNYVEFVVDGKLMKYEFYLENYVMEDALVELIAELKTKYPDISIAVKVNKKREPWFESWFGQG